MQGIDSVRDRPIVGAQFIDAPIGVIDSLVELFEPTVHRVEADIHDIQSGVYPTVLILGALFHSIQSSLYPANPARQRQVHSFRLSIHRATVALEPAADGTENDPHPASETTTDPTARCAVQRAAVTGRRDHDRIGALVAGARAAGSTWERIAELLETTAEAAAAQYGSA